MKILPKSDIKKQEILSEVARGFEKDKEYHKIAEARIKKHIEQRKLKESINDS